MDVSREQEEPEEEESQVEAESRRLSAIGELQSSMEEPSQIQLEATQAHDIEIFNSSRQGQNSSSSSRSIEGENPPCFPFSNVLLN